MRPRETRSEDSMLCMTAVQDRLDYVFCSIALPRWKEVRTHVGYLGTIRHLQCHEARRALATPREEKA